MKRNTILSLASVTALAAAAFGGPAAAQNFYVKAFGGATFPQDDDFRLNTRLGNTHIDSGLDYSNGYTLGVAGGYMITPNFALELEYAFRHADVTLKDVGEAGEDGRSESNAFMLNAIYNFTPIGPTGAWQPYIGGGLGTADLKTSRVGDSDYDGDYTLAYQVIGGVAYSFNPNFALAGELRFFGINDQDMENDNLKFKTTYHTWDLLIGARYAF